MQKVIIWRYPHHTLTNLECKPESRNGKLSFDRSIGYFCPIRHFCCPIRHSDSIIHRFRFMNHSRSIRHSCCSIRHSDSSLSITLDALSTSSIKKIHTTNRQCGTFPYLFYRTDENAFAFIFGCFVCKI